MAARSIGEDYWKDCTTNDWIRGEDGKCRMTISNDLHSLGSHCHVEMTRLDNGSYKSVAIHYEISGSSGDITIYSSEPFAGRAFVKAGV